MSDYYLFNLRFTIRAEAPASLHTALTRRAAGDVPARSDIADLPATVQDYLSSGGFPGDGVYLYERTKYFDPTLPSGQPQYRDGFLLRLSQTFHDDEYFNGGLYYPYWLMQFAGSDGQLGTMHQINGDEPPTVLTKVGSLLHETELAYAPDELWPIPGNEPPNANAPLIVRKTTTHKITELIDDLQMFSDGPNP